jgi:hypothetical protein
MCNGRKGANESCRPQDQGYAGVVVECRGEHTSVHGPRVDSGQRWAEPLGRDVVLESVGKLECPEPRHFAEHIVRQGRSGYEVNVKGLSARLDMSVQGRCDR